MVRSRWTVGQTASGRLYAKLRQHVASGAGVSIRQPLQKPGILGRLREALKPVGMQPPRALLHWLF